MKSAVTCAKAQLAIQQRKCRWCLRKPYKAKYNFTASPGLFTAFQIIQHSPHKGYREGELVERARPGNPFLLGGPARPVARDHLFLHHGGLLFNDTETT